MRPHYDWKLARQRLELGARTLVMGIVNVTPDSFSDSGRHLAPNDAVEHALRLLNEGADLLDIGGESTRPGVKPESVSASEELRRVLPVIKTVLGQQPRAIISVDTYKADVARECVQAGAEIVNDVSAGRWDSAMPTALAELQCGVVLMHSRGRPDDWSTLPRLSDDALIELVGSELYQWTAAMIKAGVRCENVVLDPGFGFGKRYDENLPLLARLDELHALGFPLMAGTSRKSFIGRVLAKDGKDASVNQRLYGTLATVVGAVFCGVHIVRVHDVKAAVEATKVADAVVAANARLGSVLI